MFEAKVISEFSAAHSLRHYKGKCEALHGHNWKVEAVAAGEGLDKIGMLMDFKKFKSTLHKTLDKLDHKHLNSLTYFKKVNPTSENIAKYIFDKLKNELRGADYELRRITVWESQNSCATYYE